MTASKDGRPIALPDPDPSIALAQTVREEFERKLLARHPMVDQLIERDKKKRVEFIAALLRRFAVRLKSLFRAWANPTTSVRFVSHASRNQSRAKHFPSMLRNRDAHPAD